MTAPSWPDLFSALYSDTEGLLELRTLPEVTQKFVKPDDSSAIRAFLRQHEKQNLYFGVALRKTPEDGTLANCGDLTTLYADLDFKSSSDAEVRAALDHFPYKPTGVVCTGGGLHCYWRLVEPLDLTTESDRARSLLRRLALAVRGDLSAAEPARILRVPSTRNFKYQPPRPVRVELLDSERQYHASEFDDWLPPEPENTRLGEPFTLPDEIAEGDPGRDNMLFRFGRKLKCAGLTEGEIRDALLAANVARCKPPLPREHVNQLAAHAATLTDRQEFQHDGGPGQSNPDMAAVLAPLNALEEGATLEAIEGALRTVAADLGGADGLRRATVREAAVQTLGRLKLSSPAKLVDAAFATPKDAGDITGQGDTIFLPDPELWPEPVDGAQLLDDITGAVARFVSLPKEAAVAVALFSVNAHAHEAGDVSPLLGVKSAVKRCGKTTLLSILSGLVPRPLFTSNISPAGIFRIVQEFRPTLLVDEADTFVVLNEELRGMLNSGHTRKSAVTVRVVGDNHEPRAFSTWCPKAIALIGKLPDTLADRSLTLTMKRRVKGDKVERFRVRKLKELEPLCRQAARWAKDHLWVLPLADPDVPESLDDRAADNWRPLLAIADLAGGDWPARARKAAQALSSDDTRGDSEIGVLLLGDLRTIFEKRDTDRLASAEIVKDLIALEERPWGDWRHGKPMTARHLSRLLEPFGIRPDVLRSGETTFRGYEKNGSMGDAFSRYLPPYPKHPQQINNDGNLGDNSIRNTTPLVTHTKPDLSMRQHSDVTDVTDENPETWGNGEIGSHSEAEEMLCL